MHYSELRLEPETILMKGLYRWALTGGFRIMGASAPTGGGHLARRCPQPDPMRTRILPSVRGGPGALVFPGGWVTTTPLPAPRSRPRFLLQVRVRRGVTLPVHRGWSGEALGREGAAGSRSGTAGPHAGAHGRRVRWVLQSQLGRSTAPRRCAPLLLQPLHLLPDSPPHPP